jgi:predicted RNase H-like HicB family nuclease
MRYTFVAVVIESAGGGYVAYVEELPGAVARGDTPEDALTALRHEAEVTLASNRRSTWEPYRDAPVVKRGRIKVG